MTLRSSGCRAAAVMIGQASGSQNGTWPIVRRYVPV